MGTKTLPMARTDQLDVTSAIPWTAERPIPEEIHDTESGILVIAKKGVFGIIDPQLGFIPAPCRTLDEEIQKYGAEVVISNRRGLIRRFKKEARRARKSANEEALETARKNLERATMDLGHAEKIFDSKNYK